MSNPTVRKRAGFAGIALAASFALAAIPASAHAASVGLGTAGNFSVLGGSAITNTGPTTMSAQLGLSPGSAVTGAPVASATHISDGPALQAKTDLVTAYNTAAGQASTALATAELSGRRFTAGAYKASSSLMLSAGSVTLDAQGDPNAVFVFQIGSTLISGSGTSVALVNGAQACNVFWQVGSSATFGTSTSFVGTVMALTTITANTAATFRGRLLARNAAVNLDTNTIVTSTCADGSTGGGGSAGGGGESPSGGDDSLPPGSQSTRRGTATLTRSPASGSPGSPGSPTAPGSPGSPRERACASGFRGAVRGRQIKRVVFRLDGKRVASRVKSPFRVFVRALPGRHVVTARVTFKDATAAKTLRMDYRACAAAVLRPRQGPSRFTG